MGKVQAYYSKKGLNKKVAAGGIEPPTKGMNVQ